MNFKSTFENLYRKKDPWSTRKSFREKYRLACSFSLIPKKKYERVLDVGCGEGFFTKELVPLAEEVLGIDVSKTAVNRAKREFSFKNLKFVVGDIRNLNFPDEYFDLICCLETLYYFPSFERENILQSLSRILNPRGYILLSARVKRGCSITGDPYFSYDEFLNLIAKKFRPIKIVPTNTIFPSLTKKEFHIFMKLTEFFPKAFASQIVILASKKHPKESRFRICKYSRMRSA